jgi:uncharacterized spore protein YtfJ
MSAAEILGKIGDSLVSSASVKSVFGEPIHMEGKTVVPVAKVAYGFGGGAGTHPQKGGSGTEQKSEGGGGGGGMTAFPAGALEITADRTRFIPFVDLRLLAGAFSAGVFVASLLFNRKR